MSQNPSQNPSGDPPANQQQSLGDIQIQGDDNTFNVIQAQVVTLTQTKIIQISVDEIKTRELNTTSPYKGLKKFEPEDTDRFFGRDQFIAGLVNELEQTNFLLLLGASGSGKSSVVRAGLIPWLQQARGKAFVSLLLTPDLDPFESLYGSLLSRGCKQSQAQVARAGKTETLSQVVASLKPPKTFWLIFIDQFEELFTLSEAEKRDRFIHSLVKLSQERAHDPTLRIVATMRSDFLNYLDPAPANRLAKLTEKHRPLITQMHPDELRLAIEQPAAQHGVVFETGLVEEIIKDAQGQAGYLPLLQYALDLLWETEQRTGSLQDRTLNISTYRSLGGIRGALQNHAESIYADLSALEQSAIQRIFLKLVGIGGDEESETDWKPIRKRADRQEFNDALEQSVLTRLIDANLLVSDRQPHSQQSTIELAHEVLLSSWTMLNDWIQQNRQAIALRNRLNDDVARWQAQQSEDELWGGSKLEQALELRKDANFNQVLGGFNEAANQFIDDSLSKRDRQRQKEQAELRQRLEAEKQAREAAETARAAESKARKAAQMRTRFAAIAAGLAIVTLIAGGFVWRQQQQLALNESLLNRSLDIQTPDTALYIRDKLPALFSKAEALKKNGKLDDALVYYRRVHLITIKLLTKISEGSKSYNDLLRSKAEIENFSKKSEAELAALIAELRLNQDLKKDLENPAGIGKRINDQNSKDGSHFSEGALRTTYRILMRDIGLEADLNGSSFIDSREEALQIPCQTLDDIEKLWREATGNRCGWFGADFNYSDYKTDCKELNHSTLISELFIISEDTDILDRFKECKVGRKPPGKPVREGG